jgi:hypothetical protein
MAGFEVTTEDYEIEPDVIELMTEEEVYAL